MYKLSVCALFKNESHCIKEWIEHYLFHGADHFYLLDDESNDDYQTIIETYLNSGIITLIKISWDRYLGRQKDIYNHYMLPLLHETQWLLMCDLDEFMWSPKCIDLKQILYQCNHWAEIQVAQTLFGSNGHDLQPKSLVESFTKRRASQNGTDRTFGYKYFIHSNFAFLELNVHYAIPKEENKWFVLGDDYFILNHYCCQSKEYFSKKCNRTDVNEFKKITMNDFQEFDNNEIEDIRLYEQNKEVIYNLK
jgi:hypothetical protein